MVYINIVLLSINSKEFNFMNEYGLVDLDNPQWLERNIKQYGFRYATDIVRKAPPIDFKFQYHAFLMNICNNELRRLFLEYPKSKQIKAINDELGVSTYLQEKSPSIEMFAIYVSKIHNVPNHLYPFLELYRAYHNLDEFDAVRSLLR